MGLRGVNIKKISVMLFESEGDDMEEDTDFLREIEEAYQLHDEGKFHHMNADKFLKELRKW